jgi:hypothetical protein
MTTKTNCGKPKGERGNPVSGIAIHADGVMVPEPWSPDNIAFKSRNL